MFNESYVLFSRGKFVTNALKNVNLISILECFYGTMMIGEGINEVF